jgi:hypothetical protein
LAIFKYSATARKRANYPSVKVSTGIRRLAMAIEQVVRFHLKLSFQIHQNKVRIATDCYSAPGPGKLESFDDPLRDQPGDKRKGRLPMNMGFGKQKR